MKVSFSTICFQKYFAGFNTGRNFFYSLLLISMAIPATLFSQTTPLSFNLIPYSDPDIVSPGRGAEQWDFGSEKINNPTADTNIRPLDVYYRFAWTVLEGDSINSYNWTFFDDIMQQSIDNKQKLSFGIMPVYDDRGTVKYDNAKSAYPLYLHKLMQAGTPNTRDWISHGVWIPNWNSTHYLTRLRALHEALYKHIMSSSYKGVAFKDAIYCIDIRGYGNYGEWHNAGIVDNISDYPVGRRAGVATLRTIIAHHTQVFSQWPLTIMIAAFDAEQFDAIMNPAELTYYALTTKNAWGPLGWRRDQWGATDTYLDKILKNNEKTFGNSPAFKELITTRYLTSPITGEPPRYINEGGPCELWDLERQLTDYGATSLGNGNWGVYLSECGRQNARASFKRTGYRIILQGGSITSNIGAGKPLSITLQWKNIGIAPTYENWDVIFELKNDSNVTVWSGTSKFKPKRFVPADTATSITDTYTLPANFIVGKYKLNMIIKDPTGYRAHLPLAIKGRNLDGSYTISEINTSPVNCVPPVASIRSLSACKGQLFELVLDSATGPGPHDLVINGITYNDIAKGQTIAKFPPPDQKIWNSNPAPKSNEDSPVELGLRFKSSVGGLVKGIRFFSSNAPSGKYTGHLWTSNGRLIDSAVFSNVTANGWQEVLFKTPVLIKADTTYMASYHTSTGHYTSTSAGLVTAFTNGPLTALANSLVSLNGLYSYGASPTLPVNSFNATNYWVDVIFAPNTYTFNLTGISDNKGCSNTGLLQTVLITPINCDTIPPVLPTAKIASKSNCNNQSFSLSLDSATGPGPYDLVINGVTYPDIAVGKTILTQQSPQVQKIWDSIPSSKSYEDGAVELGVKFKSSIAGFIKGIRFFSSSAPSGVYTGHIWTGGGVLLDSAVFSNITPGGWQEILFKTPLSIKADTIYIASYHTSTGHYTATSGGFLNSVKKGSLTALSSDSSGGNGLYSYGASRSFPVNSFNATNYWVDVLFTTDTTQSYTFNLTSVTDSTGKTRSGALQTIIVKPVSCDSIITVIPAPVVLPTASIKGTAACSSDQPVTLVLDSATGPGPYDLVINGTTYTDIAIGQTITTLSRESQKIWDSIPSSKSYEDGAVELGVKFKSSVAGFIKGIRFFSSNTPSGKYTGHLWTAKGNLIDSAIFSTVTASGWQEVLFKNPVSIKADTTYVASYHTASGHYTGTSGGLVNAVTKGPLTAIANDSLSANGLFSYSASRIFPVNSFNATNYWVDVVFILDTAKSYTFKLTSVTDNAGNSNNKNTLQTLSISSTDCPQGLRSNTNATAKAEQVTASTKVSILQKINIEPDSKKAFILGQNYPNPFQSNTIIQYRIPSSSNVNLSLFDMNGKLIKVLVNGSREQGTHTVNFYSGTLSSGLYFYKIQAGNFSAVKKLIIQ